MSWSPLHKVPTLVIEAEWVVISQGLRGESGFCKITFCLFRGWGAVCVTALVQRSDDSLPVSLLLPCGPHRSKPGPLT